MQEEHVWFEQAFTEYDDDPEIVLYEILLEVTEKICKSMKDRDISQTELADRLGVSRQYVSRFLNTPGNTTLKSIIEFAMALDMAVEITLHEASPEQTENDGMKRKDEAATADTGRV
ncbi:MAG: helix-turn-helix domain-containing protein [Armatimonadota bacterium]